jgi:outer membrane protein assembly factor BamB
MKRSLALLSLGLLCASTTLADDWPQWRGPRRDGISTETGLLQEWPEGGPALRWKATDIGTGYSSPIIVGGRVYVQTTRDEAEFCLALDEQSGQKIWEVPIGTVGKNLGPQYPGTRGTPTFDIGSLYCLASGGELVCLDSTGGELKWKRNLKEDFSGKVGNWAYSESVLIDGDTLVCTPGGETATLAALNKHTGEPIWQSAVPDGDVADYASIMIVETPVKQYVQFLRKGLVGVDAASGKFLWRYTQTSDQGANILTPVVEGNRVFSAGSRSGGGLVELLAEGDGVAAKDVYFDPKLAASIGGVVLIDGALYGTGKVMYCADFATGEVLWTDRALGTASICFADGRLYVRGHTEGDVALVEASKSGYNEKGRFTPPDRSDTRAWPHPVVANGGLYLRDWETLQCYEVAAER